MQSTSGFWRLVEQAGETSDQVYAGVPEDGKPDPTSVAISNAAHALWGAATVFFTAMGGEVKELTPTERKALQNNTFTAMALGLASFLMQTAQGIDSAVNRLFPNKADANAEDNHDVLCI